MADMTKLGFRKLGLHNYTTWSKQMKGLLATMNCRTAIEAEDDDHSALSKGLIIMCVSDGYLVEEADTAHAAWLALANIFQQTSNANKVMLTREFAMLEKMRDETITQLFGRVRDMREQLEAANGNDMADDDVVCAILNALLSKYSIVKSIIEQADDLLDLNELQAKLLLVQGDYSRGCETAYFTGNFSNNGSSSRGDTYSESMEDNTCLYCKKPGHWKKDCRKYKAYLARKEAESKGSRVTVALAAMASDSAVLTYTYTPETNFYTIMEDDPINYWYIDSGASSHTTGYKDILHKAKQLDYNRIITYGNKEHVTIEAVGDVILSAFPDINLVLTDVLYSPNNAFNLLSVSAAAMTGVEFVFAANKCYAYKDGKVILEGHKTPNNLYRLNSPPIYADKPMFTDQIVRRFEG